MLKFSEFPYLIWDQKLLLSNIQRMLKDQINDVLQRSRANLHGHNQLAPRDACWVLFDDTQISMLPEKCWQRNMHSNYQWFARSCNSQNISHFTAFFINVRTKTSIAESCHYKFQIPSPPSHQGVRIGFRLWPIPQALLRITAAEKSTGFDETFLYLWRFRPFCLLAQLLSRQSLVWSFGDPPQGQAGNIS